MVNLKSITDKIQVITGATRRQSRALRDIGELLEKLNGFLTEFGAPEKVFDGDNVVNARVDISTLMYRIRASEKSFRQARHKQLTPLVMDVYDKLENVRVDVYNPQKGRVDLDESLAGLRSSIESLAVAVAAAESE